MALFSAVPKGMPVKEKAKEEFLPCGHTVSQGSWLGCSDKGCRMVDEAITQDYKRWVAAGRPDYGAPPHRGKP